MLRHLVLTISCVACLTGACAWAEDSCNSGCPDGQVTVTFVDGNHTTCMCVDQSQGMDPTNEAGGPTCADSNDDGTCD
jgi:hypothetical protein